MDVPGARRHLPTWLNEVWHRAGWALFALFWLATTWGDHPSARIWTVLSVALSVALTWLFTRRSLRRYRRGQRPTLVDAPATGRGRFLLGALVASILIFVSIALYLSGPAANGAAGGLAAGLWGGLALFNGPEVRAARREAIGSSAIRAFPSPRRPDLPPPVFPPRARQRGLPSRPDAGP